MEAISLKSIIRNIIAKAKKSNYEYKSSWIDSNTDLYIDLKLSKSEIIEIILELERDYETCIISMPLSVPNFKIVYLAQILEYSIKFNSEIHREKLLQYAVDHVEIYRKLAEIKNIATFSDVKWDTGFHSNCGEFESIVDLYHSHYSCGEMICERVVELSGDIGFSLKTPIEQLISELQIWRKRIDWYGISPNEKVVKFANSNYIGNRIAYPENEVVINEKGRVMEIFVSKVSSSTIDYFWEQIRKFSPKWIVGDSSIIYNFGKYMLRNGLTLDNVTYVEIEANNVLSKEILTEIQKAFRHAKISTSILNPHIGSFLLTCPNGHVHLINQATVLEIEQKNKMEVDFSQIMISSMLNVMAPIININSFLYGRECKEITCDYSHGKDMFILAPTNIFGGFYDDTDWSVSAKSVEMCIGLLNAEYNNPISAMQIVQTGNCQISLFLRIKQEFKNWKSALADSMLGYLKKMISSNMDWQIVLVDEMYPCEYTGILSYYQNYSL